MESIALIPGTTTLRLVERAEPRIENEYEVKLRVVRIGICGTDREEASGGRAKAPAGSEDLVIGHEMMGRVVETGKSVSRVKPGDYAVFTVRRGCGKCMPCLMNRSDMCLTGEYTERGIWGRDGYQTQFVVDHEQYIVRIPPDLEPIAVLTEPLTISEKAITESVRVQFARLPDASAYPDWLHGRRCLVAGLGPVGLLAAMALRLRGATVYGLDIVAPDSPRPKWLKEIGGHYLNGKEVPAARVAETIGSMDLIFEAAGIATLEFNLLDALAPDGVYVLTGIPGGNRTNEIQGAELVRHLVLRNQAMLGSVNAARDHFQMAVDDLASAKLRWGNLIERLITHRYKYEDFETPLRKHQPDEIKAVIEWGHA